MVTKLLRELVNSQSTPDCGELGAAGVLQNFFSQHNIPAKLDVWDTNRANITATIKGDGSAEALLFACHSDVVPAGESPWSTPPYEATEKDGKIFGRGTCDMKAGLACIAAAAVEIQNAGTKLKGDIIITATAGEEVDACGVKKFVAEYEKNLPKLAGVILPEPTDFNIITSHRGICWLRVHTLGKTAHGSMPHLGINAITSMNTLLNRLGDYKPTSPGALEADLSTVSINQIHGGQATNVIPDSCFIELDIRIAAGLSYETVICDIREIIEKLKSCNNDFQAEIEIIRTVSPLQTDPECGFVQKLCQATDTGETKSVGYTTDGPYLTALNAPIVVFGPGKTALAHQPDEYVDIADLTRAVDVYTDVIKKFIV
ncbi:MAG TPA: M20 family peptidase [Phycisphaerae bacterium]|nr:M20 family peptidase [Phycisphaerae bacterium]